MSYTLPNWVDGQQPFLNAANLGLVNTAIQDLDSRVTGTGIQKVNTIAALRALTGAQLTGFVQLLGYDAVNDGGGGEVYYYDSSVSLTDNGGTIVKPNSVTSGSAGRWVAPAGPEPIFASRFGVLPATSAANNATRLQAAADAANAGARELVIGPGNIDFNAQQVWTDINVRGHNMYRTFLNCTTQLGTGVPAIRLVRSNGMKQSLSVRDLYLDGPSSGRVLGTKNANCDGIRLEGPFVLHEVTVQNFDSGIVMKSNQGHQVLRDCESTNNYYGVYWPYDPGGADDYIEGGNINGNTFANIALAGDMSLVVLKLDRVHLGFAPYGIYQEYAASGGTGTFMLDCQLISTRFEAIGNAAIFTENYIDSASARGKVSGLQIESTGFGWDNTYNIGSRNKNYAVVIGYCSEGNYYRPSTWPFSDGTLGSWYIALNYGNWTVDMGMSPNNAPAPKWVLGGGSFDNSFIYIPPGTPAWKNNSQIDSGTTSKTISTVYNGPAASMRPKIQFTSNGGLGAFGFYLTSITSDAATNAASFTVNVTGGTPSSNMTFLWSLV